MITSLLIILLDKLNFQSFDSNILLNLRLSLKKVKTLDKNNKKPYLLAILLYNYFNYHQLGKSH